MSKTVPVRKRLYHSVPWRIDSPEFFLTICCAQPGINHLCRKSVASVVIGAAENYHLKKLWNLELIVLMPDHLHAIVSTGDRHSLEALVKSWKGWTAKTASIHWQDGFFDHRLRSHASAQQKWSYVNENPVRKGFVKKPEDWPWRFPLGRAHHP